MTISSLLRSIFRDPEQSQSLSLDEAADVIAQNEEFLAAVESNMFRDVDHVLSQRESLRPPTRIMSRSLHIAAGRGYCEISSLLLRKDTPVDGMDDHKNTPLVIAAREDHEDIVSMLLSLGANIDAKNDLQLSALHLASSRGNLGVVKHLIAKNVDIKTVDCNGENPLHYAVREQKTAVVTCLLQHHAEPNVAYKDGSYPIHMAIEKGDIETLKQLLGAGAITRPSIQNPSPLFLVVIKKQEEAL